MSTFWTVAFTVGGLIVAGVAYLGSAELDSLNDHPAAKHLKILQWLGIAIFVAALASAFR